VKLSRASILVHLAVMANNAQAITSLFGSRLTSVYNSLRGELGVPQTATDTIEKLVDRIQTSPAVEDRRTAVLGLKGLSRDWREVRDLMLIHCHGRVPLRMTHGLI